MNLGKIVNIFKYYKLPDGELEFIKMYEDYGSYDSKNKYKDESLPKLLKLFRGSWIKNEKPFISCKFKSNYYPFHDIDNVKALETFKEIYKNSEYVIFCSSPDHYWGIVNEPNTLDIIQKGINWRSCNDLQYVSSQCENDMMTIRGYYEDISRKPKIDTVNGTLSGDFKIFISKLNQYFSNEGLELSVLMFKDQGLLVKFNRSKKLQKLAEIND